MVVWYAQSLQSVPPSGYEMIKVVSPHSILTVTGLESWRSPHGGGQLYVAVFLLRIRRLPFPASSARKTCNLFLSQPYWNKSESKSPVWPYCWMLLYPFFVVK